MPEKIVDLQAYRTNGTSALAPEAAELSTSTTTYVCMSVCVNSVCVEPTELIHNLVADLKWIGVHGAERILARFSPCTVATVLTYVEDQIATGKVRDSGAFFVRLLENATGRRVWREGACDKEEGLLQRMMGL